jgi:hypothetical protein
LRWFLLLSRVLGQLRARDGDRGAQRREHLRQAAILVGVIEVPLPQLLGQPAVRANHAARPVLLDTASLVVIGLARAHQHRRRRVRLVERSHLDEQAQHRLQIGRHLGGRRRALDQRGARRSPCGSLGTVQAVQLGEDLPPFDRLGSRSGATSNAAIAAGKSLSRVR